MLVEQEIGHESFPPTVLPPTFESGGVRSRPVRVLLFPVVEDLFGEPSCRQTSSTGVPLSACPIAYDMLFREF